MKPPAISYGDVREIADEMDPDGVACVEGAVSPEWLSLARAVESTISRHGQRDHFIPSPKGEVHEAADAFIDSPTVRGFLKALVRSCFPDGVAAEELTGSALRIIAGPTRRRRCVVVSLRRRHRHDRHIDLHAPRWARHVR